MDKPEMNSPFPYTQPVETEEELIDREEETNQLLMWAGDATNARLAAPRRYGKTSLLKKVLRDARAVGGWETVYVDFMGVLSVENITERIERAYAAQLSGPLANWFAPIRRSIKPSVRVGVAGTFIGAEIDPARTQTLLEYLALPARVAKRSGHRVLVVFDEFQDVLNAHSDLDAVVRSVIQHHGQVASYIFAGSQVGLLTELFVDERRAFYAQARPLELSPLAPEAVAEHVTERFLATGRGIGPAALGELLDAAAGHPQRTMFLAHHIWELTPVGGTADEQVFADAYDKAMMEETALFIAVWDGWSLGERRAATRVAENLVPLSARDADGRGSLPYAAQSLEKKGRMVRDDTAVTHWRLVDPLLARWLRNDHQP